MADEKGVLTEFTAEEVAKLREILQGLKEDARRAYDANDLSSLKIYTELLKVASPIVVKAQARLEREERARINKAHKALSKQQREAREQHRGNAPASA